MAPRVQIQRVARSTHPGVWLDRYYAGGAGEAAAQQKAALIGQTADLGEPENYAHFFHAWHTALAEAGACTRVAKVDTRMIVGLGVEAVIETSIALHHTYGVPYIPGSALKGLAAMYARRYLGEEWAETSKNYLTVFGSTSEAGYITFFDALYVSGSGFKSRPLQPDVMTVHHPRYYTGTEPAPPADWDSPTPIPFLTATGQYLIALAGDEGWIAVVFKILQLALQHEGVGAKTSSGYGRMTLLPATHLLSRDPVGQTSATTDPASELKKSTSAAPLPAQSVSEPSDSTPSAQPLGQPSNEPARPALSDPLAVGAELNARVTYVDDDGAEVELTGFDPDRYRGVLFKEDWGGKGLNLKQQLKVSVLNTRTRPDGTTIVRVRRVIRQ